MMRAAVGLGVLMGVFAIVDGAVAQPGPEPLCQVSDDPDYARRMNAPVQVGGGPVYGAARQKRYLEALRGPRGEAVTFQRKGGGPSDLSRAALEALANWKAEPARTNGVPVPVPVVIRVTFEQADPPPQ